MKIIKAYGSSVFPAGRPGAHIINEEERDMPTQRNIVKAMSALYGLISGTGSGVSGALRTYVPEWYFPTGQEIRDLRHKDEQKIRTRQI